jgi:predicted XRE-type DNA-binding protein
VGVSSENGRLPSRLILRTRLTCRGSSKQSLLENGARWTVERDVLADLGFPGAAERKLRLAYALNRVLDQRKLSQADAATVLGVSQPKVSALRHYKLAGFSVERLMNLLTALEPGYRDRDIRRNLALEIGRIIVVAA